MDPFPSIAPTTRTFVPGDIPRVMQTAVSGLTVAYRQGNRRTEQTLSLTFGHLTEQQMNLIQTHYINANGTYDIFYLPAEIWGDFESPPIPQPSDYAWKYVDEPEIVDVSFDRFTVSLELTTYAIESGDVDIELPGAGADPAPVVDYIYDGGSAAAAPARDYIINSGASR